jgi:hypothetical protein
MADELRPDELRDAWADQPVELARLSPEAVRRKAQQLEARIRWGLRAIVLLLAFLACGYASFLYFFPGTVHRFGASLTLVGFLYGAYDLYKRGPARRVHPGPVFATCAAYRAELECQRDFCRRAWIRLIAFAPGPVVFITGFVVPEYRPARAAMVATLLIAAPLAAGIPLNRLAARKYQRDIDALDALMSR